MMLARVEGKERPVKKGVIEFELPEVKQNGPCVFGPTIRDFQGNVDVLKQDDKYEVRVNPYDPSVAWLWNAKGGFCGVSRRQAGPARKDDQDGLHEHYKAKAMVQSAYVKEASDLAAPITQRADDIVSNNAQIIQETKNEEDAARERFENALHGK